MGTKLTVRLDEQEACDLHTIIVRCRQIEAERPDRDKSIDDRLRNVELALAGALRSIGWKPDARGWVR